MKAEGGAAGFARLAAELIRATGARRRGGRKPSLAAGERQPLAWTR